MASIISKVRQQRPPLSRWCSAGAILASVLTTAIIAIQPCSAIDWEPTISELMSSPEYKALTKSIETSSNKAAAYTERGKFLRGNWQEELALKDFADALRIDPNYLRAYTARSRVYLTQNKLDLAVADLECTATRAEKRRNPDDLIIARDALTQLARLHVKLLHYDLAMKALDRAAKLGPLNSFEIITRAECYGKLGMYEKAYAELKHADVAGQAGRNTLRIAILRADLHVQQKKYNEAIVDYTAAVQVLRNPKAYGMSVQERERHGTLPETLKKRADCYLRTKQLALAAKDLNEVKDLNEATLDFLPFKASDNDFSAPQNHKAAR